jgi:hypothetical protein
MIRFAWLQSRVQTLTAIAALVVVTIVALVTGPHLANLYNSTVAHCNSRGDCQTAIRSFLGHDNALHTWLGILVVVVPGILGIFWGSPLVARELETGTFKLAWTQSVSRARWLATKVALLAGAAMAIAGLLSLAVTWWASPLDTAHASWFATFDERDLVPVGYAAFAFTIGVLAGAIIRRMLPAMVTTLVIFAGARIAVTQWVRSQLLPASHTTLAVTSGSGLGFTPTGPGGSVTFVYGNPSISNSWVLSARLVDQAGHPATASSLNQFLTSACPAIAAGPSPTTGPLSRAPANQQTFNDCLARISAHYHLAVTYQPTSHYWPLQWYETGLYVVAATIVAAAGTWWVRRRLT